MFSLSFTAKDLSISKKQESVAVAVAVPEL